MTILPAEDPTRKKVQTPRSLSRLARNVIIQSLLDFAKAHKTLNSDKSSDGQRLKAVETKTEVADMFAEGRSNPWLDLSDFNLEWLCAEAERFMSDPVRLESVLKLKFVVRTDG